MWIPTYFAHGFLVTSESAEFLHKTTDYWYPEHELNLLWCDSGVSVQWPTDDELKLALKDSPGQLLTESVLYVQIKIIAPT